MGDYATIKLTADEMMAEARRMTGIDIVDTDVREPLSVLIAAFNVDSRLHAAGAEAMTSRTLRLLANRLRMQRDTAAHPEIAEQEVLAPIFVGGLGRTGSTKTQQLLAATGQFNWLNYWQVFNPSLLTGDPAEPVQPRIDEAVAYLDWFDRVSPQTKVGHHFALHDPEEESYLLEHSFRSPVPLGWSPVGGYLQWLAGQDQHAQFVHLRDTLKYFQWQGLAEPGRRWVLKSPLYGGLEPFIFDTFPDATIVMTHRRPSECITSGLRIMEFFHKPFTDAMPDVEGYLAGQAWAIGQHLHNRTGAAGTILDVHLRELIEDPAGVIERIFAACGMTFTEDMRARIIASEAENPPHKHGRFVYSPAYYGLTGEAIDERYADYVAFLEDRFPAIMRGGKAAA